MSLVDILILQKSGNFSNTNLSYISTARYLASTGSFSASHRLKIYSKERKTLKGTFRVNRYHKPVEKVSEIFTVAKTQLIFFNVPAYFAFLK